MSPSALTCSAGIMAYNEEANIANAIAAILSQTVVVAPIAELIVVASGCTDRTTEIVATLAAEDSRVRLIVQERRLGKASAINLFVSAATSPVLLMVSADVIVQDGALDAMLRHFLDPSIGMVGGHPIPVNDETTFLGHSVHLLWRLHDRLARLSPKLGEIVAFRNVVPSIPSDTAVDEISIQALVTQFGYRLMYEPEAVVYNHGPTTVSDFLRQRRRIYAGHLRVRQQQRYEASTMSLLRIGRVLAGSGSFATPRAAVWSAGAISLEACARGLGHYDHLRRRSHQVWETALTTKQRISSSDGRGQQSVLVFNIVNLHRLRLELGVRATRRLIEKITQHITQTLGPGAAVSAQQLGTLVVLLPAEREDAELYAQRLIEDLEQNRFTGNRSGVRVRVACGIIAFSQSGQALAETITAPVPATVTPVMA